MFKQVHQRFPYTYFSSINLSTLHMLSQMYDKDSLASSTIIINHLSAC